MKTATISELKNRLSAYLRMVRAGETVLVLDRKRPIARLEPLTEHGTDDEILARLAAEGILTLPKKPVPLDLLLKPGPRSKKSVLTALLDEREEERKEGNR